MESEGVFAVTMSRGAISRFSIEISKHQAEGLNEFKALLSPFVHGLRFVCAAASNVLTRRRRGLGGGGGYGDSGSSGIWRCVG
jgi:hypothetical protein